MAAARSWPASSALRARSAPCSADRGTNAASNMGVPHQQPDNLRRKHTGLAPGVVTAPVPVRRRLTTDCRVGDVLHPAISSHARACVPGHHGLELPTRPRALLRQALHGRFYILKAMGTTALPADPRRESL